LRRNISAARIGRNLTPRNASGVSAMMINALKMIADKMALSGRAAVQPHDIVMLSTPGCGLRMERDQHRREDRKVFGDVIGDRFSERK
jgi:hypothetical protein